MCESCVSVYQNVCVRVTVPEYKPRIYPGINTDEARIPFDQSAGRLTSFFSKNSLYTSLGPQEDPYMRLSLVLTVCCPKICV